MSAEADRRFLARALELAERAGRATAPNPRVGALVVKGGVVAGEGWHRRAGEAHAETQALAAAGEGARGATLYASLEPCAHTGRTPPCCEAIIGAGVARVVVPLLDPDPRVNGRGVAALRAAGLAVDLFEDPGLVARARAMIEDYLVHRTQGRAFVAYKAAVTLDGRIADARGRSRFVTGEPARRRGRALRDRYGAVIVGAGTVAEDDPELLPPTPAPAGGPFLRCIVDGRLRTAPSARLFRDRAHPVLVYASEEADARRAGALARAGAEIVRLPPADGSRLSPRALLEDLARRGVVGAVLEGGGVTAGRFLAEGVVDKFLWFIAPMLIGPDGRPVLAGATRSLESAARAKIAAVERIGEDVLLTLYPEGHDPACSPASSATSAPSPPPGRPREGSG